MMLLKNLIKHFYGMLYQLFLPLLIYPPGKFYDGKFYTLNRINIIEFLNRWKDTIHGDVIEIGAGSWNYPRDLFQTKSNYLTTDSYEKNGIDIVCDVHHLTDCFPKGKFDFALCLEVFEHIERPWDAIHQIHAILKPSGILLLTTPFNFHLHENKYVKDYWRFTAEGLRYLIIDIAGFREIKIDKLGHTNFPFSYTVVAKR